MALIRAIVEAEPVSDPNAAALYAAVSAVLVALIGGVVAVLTTRTRAQAPPPPQVLDEMATTHALPRELADMLVEVIAERDVWKNRAVRLGWSEDDA